MFSEKFVFSQLVSFLDRSLFNRIVRKYGGDRYIKYFGMLKPVAGADVRIAFQP